MNGQYNNGDNGYNTVGGGQRAYGSTESLFNTSGLEFCTNCGMQLPAGSEFCTSCGARQITTGAQSPYADPYSPGPPYQPGSQPRAPAKKKFPLAAVLIPVIAVVVIGAGIFAYFKFFRDDSSGSKSSSSGSSASDRLESSRNSSRGDDDQDSDDRSRDNTPDRSADGDRETVRPPASGGREDPIRNPGDSQSTTASQSAPPRQPTPEMTQPPTPPPLPSMTETEAKQIVTEWIAYHYFPFQVSVDGWFEDYSLYGVEYFLAGIYSPEFYYQIYINKDTGQVYIDDDYSGDFLYSPIDNWYVDVFTPKTLYETIFETYNWVRIYARWSANSATVFERDRNSLVWRMQSRDGAFRMVDAWFGYENGAITISFPTTSTKYYLNPNGTGNFGSESLVWEFETDPFYSTYSINGAYETYAVYDYLNSFELITIHVYWPNGDTAVFYRQLNGAWMYKQRGGGFGSVTLNLSGNSNQLTISSSSFPNVYTLISGGTGTFGNENINWDFSFSDS